MHLNDLPSVYDYLAAKGYKWVKRSGLYYTNSPFNPQDLTPSFCLYPSMLFKCYSTGRSGNVLTLMRHFGDTKDSLSSIQRTWTPPPPRETKPWNNAIPERYLKINTEEATIVKLYADSRFIKNGYTPGIAYYEENGKFKKTPPCLIFLHQNEGVITGGKFRFVEPWNGQRFTSRGVLGYYIQHSICDSYDSPKIVMVEGEANCNSLTAYYRSINRPATVLSTGSVTSIPKKLPYESGSLLIDFDGDEKKWKERVKMYEHLNLNPVKLVLPKSEDINSLWVSNKINLIENVL